MINDGLNHNMVYDVMKQMIEAATGMTDEEYDREFEEWNEARMRTYHDEPRKNVFEGHGKVVSHSR